MVTSVLGSLARFGEGVKPMKSPTFLHQCGFVPWGAFQILGAMCVYGQLSWALVRLEQDAAPEAP